MADLSGAGGVFLVARQLLDPSYKPHVYQDDLQRLAMIRMIAMARWSDNGELRRGQIRASVRQLAERCGLSPATMGRFLQRLEQDGAIERKRGAGPRDPDTITLLNYELWQGALGACAHRETRDETHDETHGETQRETRRSTQRRGNRHGRETRHETHRETHGETHGETSTNEGVNEGENCTPSGSGADAPGPNGKGPPKREPWSTKAGDIWAEVFEGEPPYGRIGKALKALVRKYGEEEILAQWRRYLETMKETGRAAYATPEDFAARYGYYKQHGVRMSKEERQKHRTTAPQQYEEQDPDEEIRWKR